MFTSINRFQKLKISIFLYLEDGALQHVTSRVEMRHVIIEMAWIIKLRKAIW